MNAQRIVQNCVLKNQSTVIEEMIRANLISEEYLYPFVDDVMEWWLIDSWLAERLKAQGEIIIEESCWLVKANSPSSSCLRARLVWYS